MVRLPLWHLDDAKHGVPGAGVENLKELASRLRNNPTTEELEVAAELFERAANMGPGRAAQALYLKPKGRPRTWAREQEVYETVEQLIETQCLTAEAAYEQAGKLHHLSVSRVKVMHLKWRSAAQEAHARED